MELRTTDGLVIFNDPEAVTINQVFHSAIEAGVINFKKADFTNADLSNMVIKNLTFTGAKFERTKLRGTRFEDNEMEQCKFDRCQTWRTIFVSCRMQDSQFIETHMGNCLMEEVNLLGANLVHLGMSARGYNFVMSYENGIAIIRAGCQELNLKDAKEHWPETDNKEEGAKVTLARRVAYQRGWLDKTAAVPMVIEPHDSICQGDPDPEPTEEPKVEETPAELPSETQKEEAQAVNA